MFFSVEKVDLSLSLKNEAKVVQIVGEIHVQLDGLNIHSLQVVENGVSGRLCCCQVTGIPRIEKSATYNPLQ